MNFQMFASYIKTAFRNFAKQKAYTFLNIFGLSLGIAASILIFQYVKYERSFDKFHSKATDIYRIQYNGWQNGKLNFESALAVPAAPRALKENFPEVLDFMRFFPVDGVMTYERPGGDAITFHEERMQYADPGVFRIFDFQLLEGDPKTALEGLNKAVISETAARKYFGNEDAVGKKIIRNGNTTFEITGVFKDVPENSHIRFTLLLSYETLNKQTDNRSETLWGWYDFYSFVLLKPGTDVKALQAKWDAFLQKTRGEEWAQNNFRQEFILRPLTDIHLYSNLLYEPQPADQRDGDSVYALSVIAIFILFIAWVNYINLATARSFNRANEVGVRKVMGAYRSQLMGQFLTESFILNLSASVLALLMVKLTWPSFATLTGWKIPGDFFMHTDFWWLILVLLLGGTLLSGFYPAIVLSSFRPVSVLKGKLTSSASGNVLRKGMVIFQFSASIFLISGAIIVYQQLHFMKSQDLGVTIDQTLVLKGPGVTDSLYDKHLESFKTEVLKIPGIKSMTSSSSIPGHEIYWTMEIRRLSGGNTQPVVVSHAGIDHDYFHSFGIKMAAGRSFDRSFEHDNKAVIINRALADILEFKNPGEAINEKLVDDNDTLEVIGVVENYHQMSLKDEVAPLAFRLTTSSSFYAIKLEAENYQVVVQSLEEPWKTFFPGNPLDYFFLDQYFNRQYDKDDRFGKVFNLFTVLAIFIASMGLFGLASFMALQRTKEVGIRKVLGSSVGEIVTLLSKDFLKPVLFAAVIALPLAWWAMDRWLQSFPYHISISPLVFVMSGLIVMLIAFISVSSQTLKAALTKPADTLKYE